LGLQSELNELAKRNHLDVPQSSIPWPRLQRCNPRTSARNAERAHQDQAEAPGPLDRPGGETPEVVEHDCPDDL